MIDKKIEEAARRNADRYRNYPTLSDEDRDKVSIGSFMDCAKWMREEFLKDLWHHASESQTLSKENVVLHVWLSLKMKVRNYVYISVIQKDGYVMI